MTFEGKKSKIEDSVLKFREEKIMLAVLAVVLIATVIPSFARKKTIPVKRATDSTELSANDRRRYEYFYLEALRQQNGGHFAAAFDLLNHCLSIDPNAPEAYFLLSSYLVELHQDSLARHYLEKAAALNPDNSSYLERLAQYFISAKDFDRAISAYEQLASRDLSRSDVWNILLSLYQQQKRYDKMIDAIRNIERIDGSSEDLVLSKMRVYEMMDNKKAAYATLKALADEHPYDLNYQVMIGNWLMQNGKKKDAFRIFTHVSKQEPDNTYAQSSLYDYYRAEGQDSLAHLVLEDILISPKTDTDTKVAMIKQVIQENEQRGGDSIPVLRLFGQIMDANPQDSVMAELNAAYMSLKKMPEDTINQALMRVLRISPDNAGARLQIIQSKWKRQQWDDIISLCQQAVAYNPEELSFYYFLGLAYFQKDDHDRSLDAFRRCVGQANAKSNAEIVSDAYSLMGELLHRKGLKEEAYAAYDSCLQWKQDHIACLNNYAYFLSEDNRDLEKAEQMSYRTVKAEPKNSTYLDTYAWILFMQKRYAEAEIYIDQALMNDTDSVQSPVVVEHAGDIHAMNRQMDKAVDYWQQALKSGNANPLLPKKIKLKKYIAR